MKINWKELSQSAGYRKLKNSVIFAVKKKWDKKIKLYQEFYRIIGMAQSHAHHLNKSIIDVLNEWEEKRTYDFRSYYSNNNIKHLNTSDNVKRISIRNYYKKCKWYSRIEAKKAYFKSLVLKQKQLSKRKGKKARWSKEYKARAKSLKA